MRFLAIAFVTAGLAQSQPAAANPRISWSQMIWHSAQVGGRSVEHAALMVDTRLDGNRVPAIMQLDLGSDATMFYGVPYGQLYGEAAAKLEFATASGNLAN